MNMQQVKYKTYYDMKVLDSKLRSKRFSICLHASLKVKLATKWHGPHKFIESLHPVYIIEMKTSNGLIREAFPRDRLKKTSRLIEPIELSIDSSNSNQSDDNINELDINMYDSDSDEEAPEVRYYPRYHLRPRVRPPDRYYDCFVKNNSIYFL